MYHLGPLKMFRFQETFIPLALLGLTIFIHSFLTLTDIPQSLQTKPCTPRLVKWSCLHEGFGFPKHSSHQKPLSETKHPWWYFWPQFSHFFSWEITIVELSGIEPANLPCKERLYPYTQPHAVGTPGIEPDSLVLQTSAMTTLAQFP